MFKTTSLSKHFLYQLRPFGALGLNCLQPALRQPSCRYSKYAYQYYGRYQFARMQSSNAVAKTKVSPSKSNWFLRTCIAGVVIGGITAATVKIFYPRKWRRWIITIKGFNRFRR